MVEHVVVKPLQTCREAVEILDLVDVIRATEGLLQGVDSVSIGKDRATVVYIWRPDEFTKKRIKVKLKMRRRSGSVEIEARGGFDMDIVITCTETGEAAVVVTVHGKGEKYVSEEALRRVAESIYEVLKNLVS